MQHIKEAQSDDCYWRMHKLAHVQQCKHVTQCIALQTIVRQIPLNRTSQKKQKKKISDLHNQKPPQINQQESYAHHFDWNDLNLSQAQQKKGPTIFNIQIIVKNINTDSRKQESSLSYCCNYQIISGPEKYIRTVNRK